MHKLKDSGIKWIGDIPGNWNVQQLKYLLQCNDGGVWGSDPTESEYDKTVLRSTEQTIDGKWDIQAPAKRNLNGLAFQQYRILPDDLLITKSSGSTLHIGKTTLADSYFYENECYYSNFLQRLRTSSELSPKLAWYLMNNPLVREQFVWMQNSTVGIGNINADNINNIVVPTPPLSEQKRIADFLDGKCAEIDGLVADVQSQIDTLEQYKRSVITETVTKGLNPDAQMKDSGIEWVPRLPANWHVIPAKYLFHNSDGRKRKGDQQLTASQRHGIITQQEYMDRENAKIVFANQGLDNWKHVEPNDFIISLRSFQGGLEMSETTGCITWHYVVLKATRAIIPRFYKWLFKSSVYINTLQGTCNFIRDGQDLRFSNFAQATLFEPPLAEQRQIADYLDTKITEIDGIIDQKKEQLSVLDSYKKSLIYEYVTGKKEVSAQ